jgi:ribose transport system permease protein
MGTAGIERLMNTKTLSTSKPGFRTIAERAILSEYFVLYLSILYMLVLWPFIPWLFGQRNIADILSNTWPLLALAIGQTFVLITAGIDLSQTSIMAVTSVAGAVVMTRVVDPVLFTKSPLWGIFLTENGGLLSGHSMAIPVAILVMLVIGSLIGLINGLAVAIFRMPAFMVTLVTMMFFSSFAIFLTKSENIRGLPDTFLDIGQGSLGPFPYAMMIAVLLAVAAHLLMTKTLFGRRLYATGTNAVASAISGVPTRKVVITAYMISGFCAAVGSVLYSARLEMGRPTLGATQLLDIVGANVIGGISLSGGKGKVTWTFFGVFFFVLLANTLNLMNLSFYLIDLVKGFVILGAALLDVLRTNRSARSL